MRGSICDLHLRRHIKNDKCYFEIFTEIKETDAAIKNFVTNIAKCITIAVKNIIDRVRTARQVPADGMLPLDEKPDKACVAAPASAAT